MGVELTFKSQELFERLNIAIDNFYHSLFVYTFTKELLPNICFQYSHGTSVKMYVMIIAIFETFLSWKRVRCKLSLARSEKKLIKMKNACKPKEDTFQAEKDFS